MKWLFRETFLITSCAALIIMLQPAWLAQVIRLELVAITILTTAAIIERVFDRERMEPSPAPNPVKSDRGEVRHMSDIEQANDFLVAVDYQLYPFLHKVIRDIAAHRLLIHHNVTMDDQALARRILGDEVWNIVRSGEGDNERRWGVMSQAQLSELTRTLERL